MLNPFVFFFIFLLSRFYPSFLKYDWEIKIICLRYRTQYFVKCIYYKMITIIKQVNIFIVAHSNFFCGRNTWDLLFHQISNLQSIIKYSHHAVLVVTSRSPKLTHNWKFVPFNELFSLSLLLAPRNHHSILCSTFLRLHTEVRSWSFHLSVWLISLSLMSSRDTRNKHTLIWLIKLQ